MSLSSILSSYGSASSSANGRGAAQTAIAAAKPAATKPVGQKLGTAAPAIAPKTTVSGDSAVISAAALAKADNAKDFTTLSKEVRATLDKQYANGASKRSPGLSGLTDRALAAISLNKTGAFNAAETAAAKTALRDQMRTGFSNAMSLGGGISGLTTYSKQVVSQYDGMSSEERQARGWTDKFRASNATFVGKASMPTLFDQFD